jgi:hypothetical protein
MTRAEHIFWTTINTISLTVIVVSYMIVFA